MDNQNVSWLPHLKGAVPTAGYGNRLSTYLIALEAWRRGIGVTFFALDNIQNKLLIRYSLKNNNSEHIFDSSNGDLTSEEANFISENKDVTKEYLSTAKVPVPEGKRFAPTTENVEIINYAATLGYPVVIKPRSEKTGKGVFANISNERSFKEILLHVRNELNYKDVIVEKHIKGEEYRILMIKGEILGAVNRVPANIIGDGVSSVEELITQKNDSKKKNPNLSKNLIDIDKEVLKLIEDEGYELNSILDKGKRLFLRNKSNISMGGDPIDVTEKLTPEIKEIAIKAFNAIPNLAFCGLDMIISPSGNTGTVIEINTKPALGPHVFPVDGYARDVISPIVDYYFPETRNVERSTLYFDFNQVISPLKKRLAKEVIVRPISAGKLYAKEFIISGEVKNSKYKNWIKRQVLQNGCHGFIKDSKGDKIILVVAGNSQNDIDNLKTNFHQNPDNTIVNEVIENEYSGNIKVGFQIKSLPKTKIINRLEEKLNSEIRKKKNYEQKLKDEKKEKEKAKIKLLEYKSLLVEVRNQNKKIIEEKNIIQSKYHSLRRSRSWRYTKPIRSVLKFIDIKR
ncbi:MULTISPECIES: acylphosphatase [Bacillaceae]|uniref:Acylphosphatase n=1 Tax=Evansella alkalicola TaxID=745819 RepID=A0ABS6JVV8_9BACI|nr:MULTISPECIES: acylphosphatase [Bacillaceae]MBU9722717.1 acylphosphatase [Bacillus alkalicola]